MKHILYPTDFSENSEHALPYALELARLFDAEITFFNSYKLPYSKSNLLVSMTDRMKKDSEDSLKALKEKVLSDPLYQKLNIKIKSRSGGFVFLIPKVAIENNSDLIVMGTKGASGLKEMFIGSNTLEVIQTSHCPVLAIPENAKDAKERKFNKIAMATDLHKVNDLKQLGPLFEIAKKCNSPIEFVNIIRPEDKADSDERSQQVLNLEEMAHGVQTSIHFATNSDIIDGLSDYINHKEPDLFAMLARKHSLFERLFTRSITNKLSFRTEIPLLVMDE
jgi:nucleotide-binding universal stress UspA family protein